MGGGDVKAAGIMFVTPDNKVLLMLRAAKAAQDGDHVGDWAFPGGGLEDGEDNETAARRELKEEAGVEFTGALTYWTRRIRDGVDFTTFIVRVPEPFTPTLNDEHDDWGWFPRTAALNLNTLHPGPRIAIARLTMDELGVAKAIRDGDLTSPQYYGKDMMLVALRITGTGMSYRPQVGEFVWRDSSIYMNAEFLERCNGLEVIFRHPKKTMLNTEEFRDRIVGTIFVPYLKPEVEEVWGIAKIRDMHAAKLLENEDMSTSPGVLCLGNKTPGPDGKPILIEDKPFLLDHLAILLEPGVWDKGGPLAGVESVDAGVDEEQSPLDLILRKLKLNDLVDRIL